MSVRTNMDFALDDATWTFQMAFGSPTTALLGWNDPRNFAEIHSHTEGAEIPATSTKAFQPIQPWAYNFQSTDGYGYLLAADSFNVSFFPFAGPPGPFTQLAAWKLFYRFVDIPLSEFVGIVQSTQQT